MKKPKNINNKYVYDIGRKRGVNMNKKKKGEAVFDNPEMERSFLELKEAVRKSGIDIVKYFI